MTDDLIEAVQASVVAAINTLGIALLGADFTQITESPIPDDEIARILETAMSEYIPSVEELRGLAAWWRRCSGTEQFKQGADWCAAQLNLALDGRWPGNPDATAEADDA